jgi:outer membrane protein assembly factor BamB
VEWPQWRGTQRDGRAPWLPDELPPVPPILWQQVLPGDGVGGIAAAQGTVVLGCRDFADQQDLFLAFDAVTGEPRWQVGYPAEGALDYGNSPRATPLIHDGLAYLLGAFGHLTCVDVATGAQLWQRNIAEDFGTPPLDWGLAGSPLLFDGRLYVQPGGIRGSIVALDPLSGETLWATGTTPPGHSSLVTAPHPQGTQLVGYDKHSLGGWNPVTGERLWTVVPEQTGDFNVPTPIVFGKRLFVTTENNGSRLYDFRPDGGLDPKPFAVNPDLCPDSHSPVVGGDRVFGLSNGLHCLKLQDGLQPVWQSDLRDYYEYGAAIASADRVLVITLRGTLVLLDATSDDYRELGRLDLQSDRTETLSHPALLGRSLYVRIGTELMCLDLETAAP